MPNQALVLAALPVVVVLQALFASPPATDFRIERAFSRCAGIDAYVAAHSDDYLILATVSSGRTAEVDVWRRFETEEARAAADTGDNLNGNASVWLRDQKVILVRAMYQSPSRDWGHYVDYYLDEAGRLVRAVADLRTFYGRVHAVREHILDEDGKVIKRGETFFRLGSEGPLRQKPDFLDHEPRLYKRVSDLPFLEWFNGH